MIVSKFLIASAFAASVQPSASAISPAVSADQLRRDTALNAQHGAAKQKIVDAAHALVVDQEQHLAPREIRRRSQRRVRRLADEARHLDRPAAVALCEQGEPSSGRPAALASFLYPFRTLRRVCRKAPSAADRKPARIDRAFDAELRERGIRHFLAEGAKGRPLSADQRQHRKGQRAGRLDIHLMVAADPPRRLVLARRQRPDAGEDMHDLVVGDRDIREHAGQRAKHVALLVLQADRLVGIVDPDVGRAHHRGAGMVEGDADAPVLVLVVDHVAVQRLFQRRVADHQMRALGALHAPPVRGRPDRVLDAVDPGAGRVHHEARRDPPLLAGQPVTPAQRLAVAAGDFGVGKRPRVAGIGFRVEQHLQADPLGMADLGIVVEDAGNRLPGDAGRHLAQRGSGLSSDAWAWSGFSRTAGRRASARPGSPRPDAAAARSSGRRRPQSPAACP